jgi:hypothetical protein
MRPVNSLEIAIKALIKLPETDRIPGAFEACQKKMENWKMMMRVTTMTLSLRTMMTTSKKSS